MDKQIKSYKNPLTQLMGYVLARTRGGEDAHTVAKDIGCASSTYRLAESGQLSLNPSLAYKIAINMNFDYTALAIFMSATKTVENEENLVGMQTCFNYVSECNPRLAYFNEKLGKKIWQEAKVGEANVKNCIKDNKLDVELIQYLRDPYYSMNEAEDKSARFTKIEKMLGNMDENHFRIIENIVTDFDNLPKTVLKP